MTVAAVDIGTNSVRVLVTDDAGRELDRQMVITRLGEGVDKSGSLSEPAMRRTLQVLHRYAESIQRHRATQLRITATSAARDAANRDTFINQVEQTLGQRPEILSGDEEAKLSFSGALASLPGKKGPFCIFDIGGGSTEFALGATSPDQFISIDVGGVRISERFLHSDPPRRSELQAAERHVQGLLDQVTRAVSPERAQTWVGLAGTVTTLASLSLELTRYAPEVTHGSSLSAHSIEHWLEKLAAIPTAARRKLLLEPKRAEVIVGGAIVLKTIMTHYHLSQITVSEQDILDGLAASLRC